MTSNSCATHGVRRVDDAVIVRNSTGNYVKGGIIVVVMSLGVAATVAQMLGHPFMQVEGAGWFAVTIGASLVFGMTAFVFRVREFRVERAGEVTTLVRVTRVGPFRAVRRVPIDAEAKLEVERDSSGDGWPRLVCRYATGYAVLHGNEDEPFLEGLKQRLDELLAALPESQRRADSD